MRPEDPGYIGTVALRSADLRGGTGKAGADSGR